MQKFQDELKAKNFEEVEKTADAILKLMGSSTQSAGAPAEEARKRLTEKVARIYEGAEKWQASGRNPSAIGRRWKRRSSRCSKRVTSSRQRRSWMVCSKNCTQDRTASRGAASPEDLRKLMRHKLDSSYVVFRDKVQEELKLTGEQKEKLEEVLPDVMRFFQRFNSLKPEEQKRTQCLPSDGARKTGSGAAGNPE